MEHLIIRINALHFTQPLNTSDFARLICHVSPEKRARIARFWFWQDAHRALYGELLARFSIHQSLARPMDTIAFETTDKGKPFLSGEPGFHFNLSHSGDWVLCATADSPIGVDVERIKSLVPGTLAEVFTSDEHEVYERLPEGHRVSFFYALWTIKESYAKATGLGLQLRFRYLTVLMINDDDIQIQRYCEFDRKVRARTFKLDSDHPAAICVFKEGLAPLPLQVNSWEAEEFIQQIT